MLLARSGFQERNTGRRGGVRAQLEGLIGREQAGSTRLPFCNQLRPLRGVERLNGTNVVFTARDMIEAVRFMEGALHPTQ